MKWLRRIFGRCDDRWSHDWERPRKGCLAELGDKRVCKVCGVCDTCVGYLSFMDADPMAQWQRTDAVKIIKINSDTN